MILKMDVSGFLQHPIERFPLGFRLPHSLVDVDFEIVTRISSEIHEIVHDKSELLLVGSVRAESVA